MRKAQRAGLARDYVGYFPRDWKLNVDTFWRRSGEWVEYIQLRGNPSLPQYQFVHSFDFLLDENELMMAYLLQSIRSGGEGSGPLIVDVKNHTSSVDEVFVQIVDQVRPPLLFPLTEAAIVDQLKEHQSSWHSQLGLILFYANRGQVVKAEAIRDTFVESFRDRLGPRYAISLAQIDRIIALAKTSLSDLHTELRQVEIRHLQELRAQGFEI